eukprot:5506824-Pleurochrysis_carterae.AAC.1
MPVSAPQAREAGRVLGELTEAVRRWIRALRRPATAPAHEQRAKKLANLKKQMQALRDKLNSRAVELLGPSGRADEAATDGARAAANGANGAKLRRPPMDAAKETAREQSLAHDCSALAMSATGAAVSESARSRKKGGKAQRAVREDAGGAQAKTGAAEGVRADARPLEGQLEGAGGVSSAAAAPTSQAAERSDTRGALADAPQHVPAPCGVDPSQLRSLRRLMRGGEVWTPGSSKTQPVAKRSSKQPP